MKRFFTVAVFLLGICLNLHAQYKTGQDLNKYYEAFVEYGKTYSGMKAVDSGTYMGIVLAIVDIYNATEQYPIPANVKAGQLYAIVGKYLTDHPEEWNESASEIVARAMYKTFPKQ
jgi:hypothetical protein